MSRLDTHARVILGLPVARRVTLALICAPPLLAFAVFGTLVASHNAPRVRSGEALTDMYMQTLADNNAISQAPLYSEPYTLQMVSPQQWRRWDTLYGDNPQYWMLCYYRRGLQSGFDNTHQADHAAGLAVYLEEARRRGVVDWYVLAQLLPIYTNRWTSNAMRYEPQRQPRWDAPLSEKLTYRRKLWRIVQPQHGSEYQQLKAQLLRLGADRSLAHYALARSALDRGDAAEAQAQIAAGNAAPQTSADIGPPYSESKRALSQGQALGEDDYLCGWLASVEVQQNYSDWLDSAQLAEDLAQDAEARQDRTALIQLHRACYRMNHGALDYAQVWNVFRATKPVLAALDRLTPAEGPQRQVIEDAKAKRAQLGNALRAIYRSAPGPPAVVSFFEQALCAQPAPCNGWRYQMLEELQDLSQALQRQQTALAQTARPLVDELAQLDLQP